MKYTHSVLTQIMQFGLCILLNVYSKTDNILFSLQLQLIKPSQVLHSILLKVGKAT